MFKIGVMDWVKVGVIFISFLNSIRNFIPTSFTQNPHFTLQVLKIFREYTRQIPFTNTSKLADKAWEKIAQGIVKAIIKVLIKTYLC